MLSPAQIEQYREDGYLMVAGYFPQVDMDRLLAVARADQALADNASDHPDADGKVSRLSLRFELPESAYSAYVRHRGHRRADGAAAGRGGFPLPP